MDIDRAMAGLALLDASWVMWALVALSLASVGVIVERGIELWRSRDRSLAPGGGMYALLDQGKRDEAQAQLVASRAPEAAIVRSVLGEPGADAHALEQRIVAESELARLGLERSLTFLGTIGSNAPFVGLLGTVIGIIAAFHELASSEGALSAGLMAEVGEALIATAIGLLVALPAVFFYNAYQRVIRNRLARAEALARVAIASRHRWQESA